MKTLKLLGKKFRRVAKKLIHMKYTEFILSVTFWTITLLLTVDIFVNVTFIHSMYFLCMCVFLFCDWKFAVAVEKKFGKG